MSTIKSMLQVFINVTAGNTIGAAVYLAVFDRDYQFNYTFLLQFIGIAAICALGDLIFYSRKELSKKQIKFRLVLHYIFVNIIVIGGAFIFSWVEPGEMINIIFLFGLVSVIYICITTAMFKNDKKTAEDLNKKLKNIQNKEE
ncbi:DUF3021 family protein [Anaerocolumna sp. MB42-C2]|uniref:DUF3021 family protein n=1 Tax=Anaerocolumna sp. MB42-C2 TaxID=3070997 RepID=UPI0027E1F0E6|nr:DUF3021 family protein [Anaerocolumna sp. MB42-C2]WMJ85544.1 DUF3021 family protein [Anaerocolumna sp. MB42-C2]